MLRNKNKIIIKFVAILTYIHIELSELTDFFITIRR